MEFRVKLFLYDFFIDYRKVCYVYINKDMKLIEDLINHISVKFDITSNLYLTTTDHVYLPHFEDIRVLRTGDSVVVSPLVLPNVNIERNHLASKKKKRYKALPQIPNKEPINYEPEEQLCMITDDIEDEDCTDSVTKLCEKKKKKKKKKLENSPPAPKPIGWDEVVSVKITPSEIGFPSEGLPKPIRVAEAVVAEFTRKKKVDLLPISTTPKIVKPIIVYGNSEHNESLATSTYDTSSSDESEKCIEIKDNGIKEENNPNSVDQVTKKRKRKRVRTRKPKLVPILLPSLPVPTPISSVTSSPHLHIRFDNDTVHVEEEKEEEVTEPFTNGIELDNEIVVNTDKVVQAVNYKDLCEKEIMSFPIMRGVEPKVNDIIAFKRFMLSEDYTPEISNYIIGNVCSYSPSTSTIVIKVLEGKEQCNEPKGKFYIEENANGPRNNQELQFMWRELIEPRLLFP
ncbi:hypothetical protein RI129_010788 [Pyrocoelia pectoralis]|uniref:Coilin n=1 Tax=Pyrocoelia pectoralis TaxID=417401 RepID=A0AAN7ZDY4_9COLE